MIYSLIVIYNKFCNQSLTLQSLEKYSNNQTKVILFDNSEKDFGNKSYAENKGYIYHSFYKNLGLSKAYNYVIDYMEFSDDDYLIILDDDTELTKEYFDEVISRTFDERDIDIFLPIVMAGNFMLSPCKIKFGGVPRVAKTVCELNMNSITAINSGMIVKCSVYKNVKYNEELFLDCVDHEFMRIAREKKLKFKVINSVIKQSFSRTETSPLKNVLFRFRIYKKDFRLYCKKSKCLWFYYLNILKFVLANVKKYKSLDIIKVLLKGKI